MIDWDAFTPLHSLLGGILIGLATALVLALNGKIAGISGVIARSLRPTPGDTAWRLAFLAGLAATGLVSATLHPVPIHLDTPTPQLVLAAFLVGFGARYGGGCTSGHGVCGISRRSSRGIAGTLTFMATAFLTHNLLGAL